MTTAVWARTDHDGDRQIIVIGGDWTIAHVPAIEAALHALPATEPAALVVDLAAIDLLDTAGAFLLSRWLRRHPGSAQATLTGANPAQEALLKRVEISERQTLRRAESSALVALAIRVGKATYDFVHAAADLLAFFGLVVVTLGRSLLSPSRFRFVALAAHIERIGLHALPILGLLSFLIGVVLAYQGADQLRIYGAEIFTVNLLGVSVLRELGILLTAIMVAGRSGSAFTAEIGTMKVNEEVDAMRTLGLDPIEVLVLPRIVAMLIALPLVAIYADVMALAGGAIMAMAVLEISLSQFLAQLSEAVVASTFWVGIVKAPVFAFLIGLVGCYEGLQVSGSAESVGQRTTKAVVESIFLVILADAAFSILFSFLGL